MAQVTDGSPAVVDQDLRLRFQQIAKLDNLKTQLLEDTLTNNSNYREQARQLALSNDKLTAQLAESKQLAESYKKLQLQLAESNKLAEANEKLQAQLAESNKKRKRDIQDLESERETRRQLQDKVEKFTTKVAAFDQGKFILVLIDADAQTNLFHDQYLTRGFEGGHAAAVALTDKVQDHLIKGLGASVEKAKALPIMIKAYANLQGLSNFCVRDQRLSSPDALSRFWSGFSRSSALVDFVDVGWGKEEADSKLREVLACYINNPLCIHVMLLCCHDAGYVPVLRPYSVKPTLCQKITLVSTGGIYHSMAALGFRSTNIFEPLFSATGSSMVVDRASLQLSTRPVPAETPQTNVGQASPAERSPVHGQTSPTGANAKTESQLPRPIGKENLVANADRLGPVLRDSAGKRVDKKLPFGTYDEQVQRIRNMNLCGWHYLRSDHNVATCKRSHDKLPRPLSSDDYDALWAVTRIGLCHRVRTGGDCDDVLCIYRHDAIVS
ncbi:hypothetical protein VTL71DRAFT_6117 [Oculimacula yallundae]|uniref:DUF7923 domain-containing protein n=1 Tax=Oculimacula yallundae TaxID=86028 RepID=A0ABR4BZF1_9HELO